MDKSEWELKGLVKQINRALEEHAEKIFKDIKEEFFDFGFPDQQAHKEFYNGMEKIKKKYVKGLLKKTT